MRILIFLYAVSSSLFYYGNAAGNTNQINTMSADNPRPGDATVRNKRDVDGGETEQDPNDPKYQKMAEELVHDNLRIRKEDIRNIKVIRVTTQLVSGTVTRMEIGITLVSGISDQCKFKIWEQKWENVKHVNYKCNAWGAKKLLSANIGTPRPEQIRDPKDPKYHKLAATSIDFWFSKTPDAKPFGKEEIDTIHVTNVKAQIGNNIKNHIHFIVISVNNTKFECTTNITETPWNPKQLQSVSVVTCSLAGDQGVQGPTQGLLSLKLKKMIPGGQHDEKPWNPKYKKIANQAFQKYQDMNNLNYKVRSTVVDKVTSQVVAGIILRIHFHVFTVNGPTYTCHSKVFKPAGGINSDIKVYCSEAVPGHEEEQDPKDPQYKILAEKSFEWYQKNHSTKITVKDIDVDKVTTQLVDGTITRIKFFVYPTKGNEYRCHSQIFEAFGRGSTFQFNVNCTNFPDPGSEVEQDAKDPKYHKLAEISFKWYQIRHNNTKVRVKSIKVNRVTTQVVAGTITRISFDVNPTIGSQFNCFSKILKELGPHPDIDYDVSCNPINGGEEEQDPGNPKYQHLAEESFQWYINTHKNVTVRAKRIKVNRVTTQVVAGLITRLDFRVYPTRGIQYTCQSKIFEGPGRREIHVNCNPIISGEEEQDPDDPKYHKLAKISFDKYQIEKKTKVTVKSIKVNRVTTQLVAGTITRISFDVNPTRGSQFNCFSKILKELGPHPDIDYDVSCNPINGGEEEQDPGNPKYQHLAVESFQWYINTHKNVTVRAKRIKVNRVTTQVVAGLITRLDFRVYPTRGIQYTCQSKIFEGPGRREIHVNCNPIISGEEEQDPDDPKYHKFAKISFDKYQIEKKTKVTVKSIKVNRVTTQLVAGTITRISFDVNPTRGSQFNCFSKILKELGPHPDIDYDVSCNPINGGEEEQDPGNPKYQHLAEESFQWYINTHKNVTVRAKRIKVNRVTTQVVAGLITRLDFRVYPTRGIQYTCQSKIFEGPGRREIHVNCNPIIGGEEEQDPNDPKYHKLAKISFDKYQIEKKTKLIVKSIKVNRVTTQLVAGLITRIHFDVHPTRGNQLICFSKIFEGLGPHINPDIDVVCNPLIGGEVEQDPDNPKYQDLAKESFKKYLNSHTNIKVRVKKIEVNRVTTQVVAGLITRINFRVHPTRGSELSCFSQIDEGGPHPKPSFHVDCNPIIGGQEEQDPDDPKYQPLAKESFEWYQKLHPNINVHIKSIKIYDVTTQVVTGKLIRMNFRVHPTRGPMFMCRSKIWERPAHSQDKLFNVSCNLIIGGEVEEDPNDPQYMKLAQQSFLWYQKSHDVGYAKHIDIDSVTSQVVAGDIIRIYFRVLPSRGSRLNCFSEIFERLGLHSKFDYNVSCANYDGGEEEQDPTKPRFLQLAKDSFRVYREAHPDELFAIREIRVTRATTQIVAGVITRLHYYVISTKSKKYVCHSEIFDQAWEDHKIFTGDCNDRPLTDGNKKLTLTSSPMSNTKDLVSNAIKEYFRNTDPYVQVDRYDTRSLSFFRTRVAKQRIYYYQVDAYTYTMTGDYANYNCSVLTGAWFGKKPFSTNCIKDNRLLGRSEWVDPTNKKFYSFAEKALQQFLKTSSDVLGPRDYRKYDIIVTFVTSGLSAGQTDYIKFFARWIHDRDDDPTVLLCNSTHWEKLDGKNELVKSDCSYMSWNRNRS